MKIVALTFTAMIATTAAHAQTATVPRPSTGSDLTRNLNAAPPTAPTESSKPVTPAGSLQNSGGPVSPPGVAVTGQRSLPAQGSSASIPQAVAPATSVNATATSPQATRTGGRTTTASAVAGSPRPGAALAAPLTPPGAAPPASSAIVGPTPSNTSVVGAGVTVAPPTALSASALAALPFSVTLPAGFQITAGRPGPNFSTYTVRRGAQPFVMIYAGPASQFPIYSGEVVQIAGRASVVTSEGTQRRAIEHLFQRSTAPGEVHVWVTSLEGTDRQIAEQIAQSVDVR